jgi:DNA repair protein RecN (Recombination protein N)
MLALRQLSTTSVPTIVFDEIDAGIGGQSALAVGQALAELATKTQILVVTHLAQVAAFARNQVAVSKHVVEGRTITSAKRVNSEDRVAELARMLSGHKDSEKARAHARELLHDAGRIK